VRPIIWLSRSSADKFNKRCFACRTNIFKFCVNIFPAFFRVMG
jgi:hypothetical protein